MMVEAKRKFALIRRYQKRVKDGFRKYHFENADEYVCETAAVYCDEKDAESAILKVVRNRLEECMPTFSGFTFEIPAGHWKDHPDGLTFKTQIKYLKDLPISYLVEHLTFSQLSKLALEQGITVI